MTSSIHPYIPFETPVRAVPDGTSGLFCWQFDRKWIPYLLAAMKPLLIKRTWESDEHRATKEAFTLWATLMQGGDCFPDTGEDCRDFTPRSPIFDFQPQNPFTQPDYIPPGYIAVPFIEVTENNILSFFSGIETGDIISGYLSLPVLTPALGEGLARFRITVFGEGTVELHLIQIPVGGTALIVVDDNVLSSRWVEMNKDLVAIPPETVTTLIHEVEIVGNTAHHIDVTFLPRFNGEVVFAAYGGGVRKVVLCGFSEMGDFVDVRQNAALPCILEKSVDGLIWSPFADLNKCPPVMRKVGGTMQYSVDGGITFFTFPENGDPTFGDSTPLWPPESVPAGESGACLAAENAVAMFQQMVLTISAGLSAGTAALGIAAAISGALAFFIFPPAGAILLTTAFSLIFVGEAEFNSRFDSALYDRLKCIISCHASSDGAFTVDEFEAIVSDVQAESGEGFDFVETWLDWNGAVGLTRMAAAAGITDGDCDDCDCGQVNITYTTGSGPASVLPGDEFDIVSASASGAQHPDFTFDKCVKFTVLSVTGFVPVVGAGVLIYAWIDCDAVFHAGPDATMSSSPTDWNSANECTTRNAFNGDNSSVFVMHIRIDEIC